jgi:D-aspartate ligase
VSASGGSAARTPILILGLTGLPTHHNALGIARSAGRMGVPVFHAHEGPPSRRGVSRYFRGGVALPPNADDEQRLRSLLELSERIGRAVLVPVDDSGAVFVQEHSDALRVGFLFPAQPPGLVEALSSKRGLQELCLEHEVPTAQSAFPASEGELTRCLREMQLPVMVKRVAPTPPSARTAPSVLLVHEESELLDAFRRLSSIQPYGRRAETSNVMVQEHIPGGAESSWMFNGYFDQRGRCTAAFTGVKLRQSPPDTGATTLGVCRRNDELATGATSFMQALGYRGIVDLDYRLDSRDGCYKLLDVNTRIGASFRLFVDTHGVDVLRTMYLDLTGAPVVAGAPKPERRWIVEPLDLRSSLIYMRRGELTPREWAQSLRHVDEVAWWARDDPAPLPAVLAQLGGSRLKRMLTGRGGPPLS